MRETIRLFYGLCKKEYILIKEYPVETIGGIASMYIIFMIIFFGGNAVGGERFAGAVDVVVVGYFVLLMGTTSFQGVSNTITDEAQWGTLERLVLSPLGFGRVTVLISIVTVGVSSVWGILILGLMVVTTGVNISLDLISIVPILLFTIATTLGFGLFASGVSVLYKRVGSVFQLFGLVFVGFIAAPVQNYPVLKLLPLAQGSYLLQRVMNDGIPIWRLPLIELIILVGVGVLYLAIGYMSFMWLVARTKKKGVMGHY